MSAYRIESDGGLRFLNQRPTGGADPCYVGLDRERRCLTVEMCIRDSFAGVQQEKARLRTAVQAFAQRTQAMADALRALSLIHI